MKKLLSIILSLVLLIISGAPIAAVAAGAAPGAALVPTRPYADAVGGFADSVKAEYSPELFTDIDESQWYGINDRAVIKAAYELRIMGGKGFGFFDPEGNITLAEAIKMAAVVHNIFLGGSGAFAQTTPWYDEYVNYSLLYRIIDKSSFEGDYDRIATRAEMAHIFANCVSPDSLQQINLVNYIPDVPLDGINAIRTYADDVYMLYRAGILTGNDDRGSFRPYSYITRAEAAAIICRIVLPSERVLLNLSQVVISGGYMEDDFPGAELEEVLEAYETYIEPGYEDAEFIYIMTNMEVYDFKYIAIEYDDSGVNSAATADNYLYFRVTGAIAEIDALTPEKPFAVTWLEAGTIPNRGISFIDDKNNTRYFSISSSGYDGSLLLIEFLES